MIKHYGVFVKFLPGNGFLMPLFQASLIFSNSLPKACRVGHFLPELQQRFFKDFVENQEFDRNGLKPLKLLHEASLGVNHLHSLKIIHR